MRSEDARAALDAADSAADRLADVQAHACPPWRHAAFGLVEAMVVLGVSASGTAITYVLYGAALLGAIWLMRDDRRRTGTWVNGWRRGRTMPLTAVLCALLVALLWLALRDLGQPFPSASGLLAALAAFVVGTLASVWWQRIYVAELRERAQP